MYDLETRKHALALLDQGFSQNSVSKQTGISRAAIRSWLARIEPLGYERGRECPRCEDAPKPPAVPDAYAYLLGLYLGDGCISATKRGVYSLRIACADAWPGLIAACVEAVQVARPANKVSLVTSPGCQYVTCFSKHRPCLFPQHGPGKKHDRRIILADWQQAIVDAHPWEFIRGLIHSDGCRIINWTTRLVGGEQRRYEYPRYFFTNLSADILGLFTTTLDQVGVEWKRTNGKNISVARRASVALMDAHVGPKY
ncbi:transcriptional regulator [Streptomyces sp. NBC_01336]|uniref:helix-turn-helix domain-containing protein n=1 Tax=Streptomyces sp. NBC_01336 TaxID=2903829 RepID=UPI002E15027C|nr:transcriptional regulator [Streptomyces sp. NBC_01336]